MDLDELPDIPAAILDHYKAQEGMNYPPKSVWASRVGHPCERYLVYEMTEWENRKDEDPLLPMRFAMGRMHGDKLVRDIEDSLGRIGIEVVEREAPINHKFIGGKVDLKLRIPGHRGRIPVELKSMSEHAFKAYKTFDDMQRSSWAYLQCYPAQLLLYIAHEEAPFGVMITRNKTTGETRQMVMMADDAKAEELNQKSKRVYQLATRINNCVKEETKEKYRPDRIPWQGSICGRCPFLHRCLPDMAERPGIEDYLGEEEVDSLAEEWLKTKEAATKHASINRKISTFCKAAAGSLKDGQSTTLALPGHDIKVSVSERKVYKVPKEIQDQYSDTATTVYKTITKAGDAGDED